jgi:hypothetical protein
LLNSAVCVPVDLLRPAARRQQWGGSPGSGWWLRYCDVANIIGETQEVRDIDRVSKWRDEALPLAVRQRLGLPQQAVEDLQARQTLRLDRSSSRVELPDIPTTLNL